MKSSFPLTLLALAASARADDYGFLFYSQRTDCSATSFYGEAGAAQCATAPGSAGPFYSVMVQTIQAGSNFAVYSSSGGNPCGTEIDEEMQSNCIGSGGPQIITGAIAFDDGSKVKGRRSLLQEVQPEVVEAHSYAYNNGTTVYTIRIDSEAGRAYDLIGSEEERIEHIVKHSHYTFEMK